jgi:hypothetical protein
MTAARHGADEPRAFMNVCSSSKSGNDAGCSRRLRLLDRSCGASENVQLL